MLVRPLIAPPERMMTDIRKLPTWLGEQGETLAGPVVDAVRRRRLGRLWTGPAAALLVAGLALAARTGPGHAFVTDFAITHPGDPLLDTLVKLPLSMFAPAALLPFWFAVLQVGVVFSLVQAAAGARWTLLVAALGHTVATLSARLWVIAGPPVGVAHGLGHFGDAGPSAAVVSLLAYVAVRRRAGWLALGLIAYHTIEVAVLNGLTQREHLVGTVTGAAVALTAAVWAARQRVPLADVAVAGSRDRGH
ncbi:hypothetical protein GCM10010199_56040 [Dactylosporangium roseum]